MIEETERKSYKQKYRYKFEGKLVDNKFWSELDFDWIVTIVKTREPYFTEVFSTLFFKAFRVQSSYIFCYN